MKRYKKQPVDDDLGSKADHGTELLRELVAHLRHNGTQLRAEWARRVHETGLLTTMSKEEILSETTSVYDNYVAVLETGQVEALGAYARDLFQRIIPRGVDTHEVLGIVLLLRDVLARSLFKKYHEDFELLNCVLDAYEPAANRIANTVGVSFVEQRERVIRLRQMNEALEQRNVELAAINRELERSEEHYRRLFHEARRMQEDLRILSNRILSVQEEERKRISRELHDEVGQALTAVNMNLAAFERGGAMEDSSRFRKKIGDTRGLLVRAMETVHSFATALRPTMLDELGLLPALRSYLKEYGERTGLRVRFKGGAEEEGLTAQQKTVLFRVAQESLTNAAKHAQASQVVVTLRSGNNGIHMRISDNGKGFAMDRQRSVRGKRLGLLGMQERVRLVNGRFAVRSMPGIGTTIAMEIPLKNGKRSHVAKTVAAAGMNSSPAAPARNAPFDFFNPA